MTVHYTIPLQTLVILYFYVISLLLFILGLHMPSRLVRIPNTYGEPMDIHIYSDSSDIPSSRPTNGDLDSRYSVCHNVIRHLVTRHQHTYRRKP